VTALAERLALVVITDPRHGEGRTLREVVRASLRGGAPCVQLRLKDGGGREMLEAARALLEETRAAGALLFVNDRLDVALAAGADGAHLGQDDLPVEAARAISPPGFLLGVSAETPALARAAERAGADYVGVGPVVATPSKGDAGPAIGTEGVAAVRAAVAIPVVAIGGIDLGNSAQVAAAGAHGVAVIRAVMQADDPEGATRRLLEEVRRGRRSSSASRSYFTSMRWIVFRSIPASRAAWEMFPRFLASRSRRYSRSKSEMASAFASWKGRSAE